MLLYGPPGTGKTLLARAVANRTDACFIRVIGSELVQKYVGEGARMVRELFEMARSKKVSGERKCWMHTRLGLRCMMVWLRALMGLFKQKYI